MADALIAFDKIYDAGIVPNRVTMVNALGASAGFRAMEVGVWTHHFLRRNEWELEVIMGTSIDVYLKCGRIDEGLKAFRSMEEKNVYAWNSLIQGLNFAVSGREAVLVVQQNGARRVCSSLINGNYGFSPSVMHYARFIELLACAGRGNLELTDIAAKKLAELESDNVFIMCLLSYLHAEVGRQRT
ncbi:hypothetical protein OIU84_012410 [Salix udensis]|uniref:Pentatricopeptide repeat-containing protein n=1 Tax=Salix udensis TaxID=889485 RepID=A0AAD6JGC3_9ROSI|nr:hypothetical protein OIU84_012410 [Salix udensis]